jgi:hypothetical protein
MLHWVSHRVNAVKTQPSLRTLEETVLKDMGLYSIGFHERSNEYIGKGDTEEVEVAILLHVNVRKGAS